MTSPKVLSDRIRSAYVDIERLLESSMYATRLLREAFRVAAEQERRHRQSGKSFSNAGYRVSSDRAAQYFIARAVLADDVPAPTSWLQAAEIRRDIALGYALHVWLVANKPDELRALTMEHSGDIDAIDYAKDIAA